MIDSFDIPETHLLAILIKEDSANKEEKKLLTRNLSKELGYSKGNIFYSESKKFDKGIIYFRYSEVVEMHPEYLIKMPAPYRDKEFVLVPIDQILINFKKQ